MKTKTLGHPSGGKTKRRRDRDLAVLAALGVRVRCSPTTDYLHPLGPALAGVMRKWLREHRLTVAGVMKRAQLSRETLRKLVSGRSWFSLNVAARRCGRSQRKKCQL